MNIPRPRPAERNALEPLHLCSQYHSAYLTSGCFSPTRAGVFFVTRMDGVMDIWDHFYRQNEVAYSHKVPSPSWGTPSRCTLGSPLPCLKPILHEDCSYKHCVLF